MINWLQKVKYIQTSNFVFKTNFQRDKTELGKKICNVTDFVKKANLTELENKIPDVSSLVTKAALTTVENKIPDVSSFVKKNDLNTKVKEIQNKLSNHNHDKYIDTPEFNKLAEDVLNARLAEANLITETDFDTELLSPSRNVTKNKTRNLLVENEIYLSDEVTKPPDNSLAQARGYDSKRMYLVFNGDSSLKTFV